ncbi:DUF2970 domain-containing protein [Aestuariibacter sp. AA17]|uniref:DUF2970 domain-containing protein n=1 Tax=Fluctibacter corallii TaxID=2984329 RepID=A0ABT3A6R1_9ALTE|nr:DUF2970 domain-containing protein [Aestuariibacter sp. AA17]MCV2884370.1 DUF2970 domain-containing protein [Aestuariibacter sp. AA17]
MSNLGRVLKSVAASAFGVQSQSNYERDFKDTSVVPYVVVGVLFVAIFVIGLALLVNWLVA